MLSLTHWTFVVCGSRSQAAMDGQIESSWLGSSLCSEGRGEKGRISLFGSSQQCVGAKQLCHLISPNTTNILTGKEVCFKSFSQQSDAPFLSAVNRDGLSDARLYANALALLDTKSAYAGMIADSATPDQMLLCVDKRSKHSNAIMTESGFEAGREEDISVHLVGRVFVSATCVGLGFFSSGGRVWQWFCG